MKSRQRYRLTTAKTDYSIRFGRLIEQQPDWIWTAIEPLQSGTRSDPLASAGTASSS